MTTRHRGTLLARTKYLISAAVVLWASAAVATTSPLRDAVRRAAGPDAIVYVVDANDQVLVDIAGERGFVPASTIKLFTALVALESLGPEYRFETRFFVDGDELVVRGSGDPFLVSEEIDAIAAVLAPRLQGRALAGVVIDDAHFADVIRVPGVEASWKAYDAVNAATAVNFNTIGVVRRNGQIFSAEPQTPLTPHALELAKPLRFANALRFRIGDDPADVRRYAGELFIAKLRQAGVQVGDGVRAGTSSATATPLYVHANSRTLAEVCEAMLASSNNFIANQVFLAVGAAALGAPASLEKSVRFADRYIAARPDLRGISIVEGSGLAYENRVTGPAMASLLTRFSPYRELLKQSHGSHHKTGTLRSVTSLAGYFDSTRHGTVRYALALPGGAHERRWQVVRTLREGL